MTCFIPIDRPRRALQDGVSRFLIGQFNFLHNKLWTKAKTAKDYISRTQRNYKILRAQRCLCKRNN